MKTTEKKELFAKTIEELKNILSQTRNELFNLKIELSQNKLKNTREVLLRRKKIAMILTSIREKELLENAKNI